MRSLDVIATLAQNTPKGKQTSITEILVVVGALIVAVVGLGLVIMFLRRRMLAQDATAWGQVGVMEELRQLRDSGQLSPEEFDAAKGKIVGRVLDSARRKPDRAAGNKPVAASGDPRAKPGYDETSQPVPKPNKPASAADHESDTTSSEGGGGDGGGE